MPRRIFTEKVTSGMPAIRSATSPAHPCGPPWRLPVRGASAAETGIQDSYPPHHVRGPASKIRRHHGISPEPQGGDWRERRCDIAQIPAAHSSVIHTQKRRKVTVCGSIHSGMEMAERSFRKTLHGRTHQLHPKRPSSKYE